MITRNDCLILLGEIQSKGIDTRTYLSKAVHDVTVNLEVLEFINKHRPLELGQFYEYIRKSYNEKRSKLYKEIVQIDERLPVDSVLTLSCLLTQILLYSKKVENRTQFLKHARADEISKVLANYFTNYDVELCYSLLTLIKADLKACELVKTKNTN